MISDREAEKANIVQGLKQSLDGLGTTVSTFNELEIPDLALELEHTMKKRRAFSTTLHICAYSICCNYL